MEKDIEYKMVDLGLPSGLKWADRNVGAVNVQDYGDYFMWGSTEKCEVNVDKCICDLKKEKCCESDGEGICIDDIQIGEVVKPTLRELKWEGDAAKTVMGAEWRMPTKNEAWELFENTEHEIGMVEGTKGMFFVNKGDSSKRIFVPFCGYCENSYLMSSDKAGYLWTSTSFLEGTAVTIGIDERCGARLGFGGYGDDCFAVRGVHE